MKQYGKYKESGIEWLGNVPEHWKFIPIKRLFKTVVGGVWGEDAKDNSKIHCIRVADFDYNNFGLSDKNLTLREFKQSELNNRLLHKGDLILEKSGGGEKTPVGRVVEFNLDISAVCSNFTNKLTPNELYRTDFLKYMFAYMYSKKVTLSHVKQTTGIQNLTIESFLNEVITIPANNEEQRKIAEYLDYTVGRVDEIVSGKQAQIDRLMDYRKSMINEVVTKGLNPDAPMRDSGVEWLGEIPTHWKATKIKYVTTKIGSGVTPTGGADVYQDSGVLFLRSQNVYDDGLRLDDVAYISDEIDNSMANSRVMDKDVLLNITGASMGRCSFANNLGRANVNQHVCILRPNTSEIYYKYLHLLICSQIGQHQIALVQTGGNREGLNFENIKNFFIPIFSIEEQTEIVNHIEERTTKIDKIVKELTSQIEKLKEYKTSIISEAVTGKIDLREWKQPLK